MPNGILNLDKPAGMTSHTAVAIVKRLYGAAKAGHSGTLDPMATGVLPIMLGSAVKASEYLTSEDKFYRAELVLGIETDSEDTTGTVLQEFLGILPTFQEVEAAAKTFIGDIFQTPPMYSALKVGGKKLVDLARKGITIERQPRQITVHDIVSRQEDGRIFLDVHCSKGTYIRTLCADIGKKLGCGGAMGALRRTATAGFAIGDSITIEALQNTSEEDRLNLLTPTESVFSTLPAVTLDPFFTRLFCNGQSLSADKIKMTNFSENTLYRIYAAKKFIALGIALKIDGLPVLRLKKLF